MSSRLFMHINHDLFMLFSCNSILFSLVFLSSFIYRYVRGDIGSLFYVTLLSAIKILFWAT